MKSYKFLKTISVIFQIIATSILVIGLCFSFYLISNISSRTYPDDAHYVMVQDYNSTWAILFGSILSFLLLMAIAQFINLFIDIAGNIHAIAKNTYTSSKESNAKDYDLIHWLKSNPTKGINDYYSETLN